HPDYAHLPMKSQAQKYVVNLEIINQLGNIAEILFYLLGAMTIVTVIDSYHGFDLISNRITTKNKRKLLWFIALITFFMSSVLDNMTSAIVMILLIQKLLTVQKERWIFGSIIIIAANAGGAWTPIGDVTTIMLWINDNISSGGIMKSILLPSISALCIPVFLTSLSLKGQLETSAPATLSDFSFSKSTRNSVFIIGILCLLAVPIFKSITGLPPFAGILLTLGIFWIYTDFIAKGKSDPKYRIANLLSKVDYSTILFFLGILLAVAALEAMGILHILSDWLNVRLHNIYIINLAIGLLSSVIDNVPLVAAAMGMYPLPTESILPTTPENRYLLNFVRDGDFWNLLAYCTGTGGSLLIIGSAAGVVVMGLEKINFIWYVKHITWIALLGFVSGIGIYYLLA
ncbi:MAG: sodium:proton antiporter NhaD, partial [Odoribacter sp.]|nr:sodium:proton antiporter NhaD [Odoribacter sp.]